LAGDTAFFRSHLSGVDLHREPAASEPAVVYREAAASEMAHRKPVTSESAAHGVTSAAKATAAMSAPPPPCPPPPPNAIAPVVVIVMPRAIAVAAAISFLRIEVSPYSGSDRPSIENVWLRCRANELQISHEENSLTLSKKMRHYIS
jgi:hypothetical protein